jgi:histone H3/H4
MTAIPRAIVARIIKSAGAERVGKDANEALAGLMEEYAASIAREALKLSSHSGRRTIRASDIRMAADILK